MLCLAANRSILHGSNLCVRIHKISGFNLQLLKSTSLQDSLVCCRVQSAWPHELWDSSSGTTPKPLEPHLTAALTIYLLCDWGMQWQSDWQPTARYADSSNKLQQSAELDRLLLALACWCASESVHGPPIRKVPQLAPQPDVDASDIMVTSPPKTSLCCWRLGSLGPRGRSSFVRASLKALIVSAYSVSSFLVEGPNCSPTVSPNSSEPPDVA